MNIILKNGLDAAKKNIGPGLLLQGVALSLLLLYYFYPPMQHALQKLPEIQERAGLLFPILSTAFFGGVVPCIFLLIRKKIQPADFLSQLIFLSALWAFLGLTIDLFYKFQAHLFGNHPDVITVIKKVLFDQFVFSVIWSAPFTTLAMYWKEHNCSFRAVKQKISWQFVTEEIPSVLIALWGVWIPTVAIIYSLPLALQIPLFNIVLCFWSLILASLGENRMAKQ